MSKHKVANSDLDGKREQILPPAAMSNDQLAACVSSLAIHICEKLDTLEPYVRELQARFTKKKSKGALISGCKTWTEFCDKVLGRSRRAVNYMLNGGNPARPNKRGGKTFPIQTARTEQQQTQFIRAVAKLHGVPDPAPTIAELFPPELEPKRPAPRTVVDPLKSVTIIGEDETPIESRGCVGLRGFLLEYERGNYGAADPSVVGRKLLKAEISILASCAAWFQDIIRANGGAA